MNQSQKLTTLLSLYIAQSIPMSFFSTVVPVIMRMEDYSLASIGLIQLVKVPWILKFLWAPFIDRNSLTVNHYKRWIIGSELFYALIIASVGFLSLKTDFISILVMMVIAFFFSATQDIATDAFAVRILRVKERGVGNGIQAAGSFIGALVGSGVLLVLYTHVGWQLLLFILAGFITVALLPLYIFRYEEHIIPNNQTPASMADVISFFKLPNMGKRILLLFLFYAGFIGMMAMIKPFFVDHGLSIEDIAFISGIFGTGVGVLSALSAGLIIRKVGTNKAIYFIAFYNVVATSFFTIISMGYTATYMFYIGAALLWGAYAMSSALVYTISMETVRPGREGSDYTIQIIIPHMSGLLMAVVSGKFAQHFGYTALFTIETGITIFVLFAIRWLYINNTVEEEVLVEIPVPVKEIHGKHEHHS